VVGGVAELAQAAAFALGQAAPDAVALVGLQGVVEALGADVAAGADGLGLAGGPALLREEGLGVGLGAERVVLPRLVEVGHGRRKRPFAVIGLLAAGGAGVL